MALVCTLEFNNRDRGWRASCQLPDGRTITISEAHSPQAARRRMRRAVEGAGIAEPTFQERLRIPAHLESQLSAYLEKDRQRAALETEVQWLRPRLAQQLLHELNLTEREVAAWLGVSHTHISALLLALTADTTPTAEYVRTPADDHAEPRTTVRAKGLDAK